jgi:hypothetical protein
MHPDRWVRLDAWDQIENLARSIERKQPRFVTLAHSQRVRQWSELESAIKAIKAPKGHGRL